MQHWGREAQERHLPDAALAFRCPLAEKVPEAAPKRPKSLFTFSAALFEKDYQQAEDDAKVTDFQK